MPPGEGIRVELVEESELSGGEPEDDRTARTATARSSIAASRCATWRSRSAAPDGALLPDRAIGKVLCRGASVMHGYFRDPGGDRRLPRRRRLARHRRHGLFVGRLHLHRRPRQGHDHHQRQEPLAAGHRVGGRAIARLQVGRHRRLRDHRARAARKRPRCWSSAASPTPPSAAACATRSANGPLDHRHELRRRAGPAAHPAAHQLGQAQPRPRRATSISPARSSPTTSPPEVAAAKALRRAVPALPRSRG